MHKSILFLISMLSQNLTYLLSKTPLDKFFSAVFCVNGPKKT